MEWQLNHKQKLLFSKVKFYICKCEMKTDSDSQAALYSGFISINRHWLCLNSKRNFTRLISPSIKACVTKPFPHLLLMKECECAWSSGCGRSCSHWTGMCLLLSHDISWKATLCHNLKGVPLTDYRRSAPSGTQIQENTHLTTFTLFTTTSLQMGYFKLVCSLCRNVMISLLEECCVRVLRS